MRKRAFTLIELLTVITIMGILAGLLLPALNQARKKAKIAKCVVAISSLETALAMYSVDYGVYPPTADGTGSSNQHNGNSCHNDLDGTPNNLVNALMANTMGGPYMDFREKDLDRETDSTRPVFLDPWGQAYIYVCQKGIEWDAGLNRYVLVNVASGRSPFHPNPTTNKEHNTYNIYSLGPDKKTYNDADYSLVSNWDEDNLYDNREDGNVGDDVSSWE